MEEKRRSERGDPLLAGKGSCQKVCSMWKKRKESKIHDELFYTRITCKRKC